VGLLRRRAGALAAGLLPGGIFLDKVGHYTAEGLLPLAIGVRADGGLGSVGGWTTVGALASAVVLYNKALNDMVHAARAAVGLARVEDTAGVSAPRGNALRRLRALSRFLPFHRAFHSVEVTLLALVAAGLDLVVGDLGATRVLAAALLGLGLVTVVGHVVAILSSRRLTA
jgi:hypothetical protein